MGEKIKLVRPVDFDGRTYMEIDLDLESLTGHDLISAERQFLANGANQSIAVKEFSKEFQAYVAARAVSVPVELIFKLSAPDFSLVTLKVQNFFLDADSAD